MVVSSHSLLKAGSSFAYQALVHTSQSHGVNLADVRRLSLQELFKCDAVLGHLSRCNAHAVWLESFADGGVAENVIRVGRFCVLVNSVR